MKASAHPVSSGTATAAALKHLPVSKSASPKLREAIAAGDWQQFVHEMRTAVGARTGSKSSSRRQTQPVEIRLAWSAASFPELAADFTELTKPAAKRRSAAPHREAMGVGTAAIPAVISARLAAWLRQFPLGETTTTAPSAVLLGLAEVLLRWGSALSAETWYHVWLTFWQGWQATADLPHDATANLPADIQLIHHGELPWLAGICCAGLEPAGTWLSRGRQVLRRELTQRVDGDGTPHAEVLRRLPLWLAPLVRVSLVSEEVGQPVWTAEQRKLLGEVLERAIPLCFDDGRAALANGVVVDPLPVLNAASRCWQLSAALPPAGYLKLLNRAASGETVARGQRKASRSAGVTSMPSNQSDWGRCAFLRSHWGLDADCVTITHHQPVPEMEVRGLGTPWLSGGWGLELQVGDTWLELADEWSCVCWSSDPDADYIELQMEGPGKLRVERLVCLSRTDHCLVLADVVSGVATDDLRLRSTFPLAAGVHPKADQWSRNVRLETGRRGPGARLYPVALPEDRVESTPHQFECHDDRIVIDYAPSTGGLFAPVVLDWSPERAKAAADWRELTVCEELKIVSPRAAMGYRLRMGAFQLLMYRSLKNSGGSRSLLGHHTLAETMIGRFGQDGTVEPLALVEAE